MSPDPATDLELTAWALGDAVHPLHSFFHISLSSIHVRDALNPFHMCLLIEKEKKKCYPFLLLQMCYGYIYTVSFMEYPLSDIIRVSFIVLE